MSNQTNTGYGFSSDSSAFSAGGNFSFGANFGIAKLSKFEYTANGGKDGAPAEALDISFNVGGRELSYRQFPVNKVYFENVEIDESHAKYGEAKNEAIQEFNAKVTHILKCFMPEAELQARLSRPFQGFTEFAQFVCTLLPAGWHVKPLDIFMGYQWQIKGENNQAYLEIPTKMKYGPFLCAAVTPVGKWTKTIDDNGNLSYVDDAGNKHPFTRGKWYMASNYANQITDKKAARPAATAAAQNLPPVATNGAVQTGSGWGD